MHLLCWDLAFLGPLLILQAFFGLLKPILNKVNFSPEILSVSTISFQLSYVAHTELPHPLSPLATGNPCKIQIFAYFLHFRKPSLILFRPLFAHIFWVTTLQQFTYFIDICSYLFLCYLTSLWVLYGRGHVF